MKILNQKELDLIRLAVLEGTIKIENSLNMDFGLENNYLTVHQWHRLEQIQESLYRLFCEVVEENCFLQSEYDK
jgi:hypothetical protein